MTMIRYFSLLFFLFSTQTTFSQSVSDLDANYGFGHLKLYTSPSEYISEMEEIPEDQMDWRISNYNYIGHKLDSLFGLRISGIELNFYNKKLFGILISVGETGKEFKQADFEHVLNSFQSLYGKGKLEEVDNGSLTSVGATWVGEKVTLHAYRELYKESGETRGFISIIENTLNTAKGEHRLEY